jgi:hypothetical protein
MSVASSSPSSPAPAQAAAPIVQLPDNPHYRLFASLFEAEMNKALSAADSLTGRGSLLTAVVSTAKGAVAAAAVGVVGTEAARLAGLNQEQIRSMQTIGGVLAIALIAHKVDKDVDRVACAEKIVARFPKGEARGSLIFFLQTMVYQRFQMAILALDYQRGILPLTRFFVHRFIDLAIKEELPPYPVGAAAPSAGWLTWLARPFVGTEPAAAPAEALLAARQLVQRFWISFTATALARLVPPIDDDAWKLSLANQRLTHLEIAKEGGMVAKRNWTIQGLLTRSGAFVTTVSEKNELDALYRSAYGSYRKGCWSKKVPMSRIDKYPPQILRSDEEALALSFHKVTSGDTLLKADFDKRYKDLKAVPGWEKLGQKAPTTPPPPAS